MTSFNLPSPQISLTLLLSSPSRSGPQSTPLCNQPRRRPLQKLQALTIATRAELRRRCRPYSFPLTLLLPSYIAVSLPQFAAPPSVRTQCRCCHGAVEASGLASLSRAVSRRHLQPSSLRPASSSSAAVAAAFAHQTGRRRQLQPLSPDSSLLLLSSRRGCARSSPEPTSHRRCCSVYAAASKSRF